MKKILIICGPTATGKTSLAVSLAKRFAGEPISADSRQVYLGMDIGTGKDKDQVSVPLWLTDIISPKKQFNVFDWLVLANEKIKNIWQQGKLPIVVGGTGLYIKSLVDGIDTLTIAPDKKLREELNQLSVSDLQIRLKEVDSRVFEAMNQSDRNNPRRLVRKIEISLSSKRGPRVKKFKADFLIIGLTASRDILYQRIDQRVKKRLELGLTDEIKRLLKEGVGWSAPGMNTLAYKEFQPFFEKKESLTKIVERWKLDEHAYARRQATWFKKDGRINWFDITEKDFTEMVTKLVKKWYSEKNGS